MDKELKIIPPGDYTCKLMGVGPASAMYEIARGKYKGQEVYISWGYLKDIPLRVNVSYTPMKGGIRKRKVRPMRRKKG